MGWMRICLKGLIGTERKLRECEFHYRHGINRTEYTAAGFRKRTEIKPELRGLKVAGIK